MQTKRFTTVIFLLIILLPFSSCTLRMNYYSTSLSSPFRITDFPTHQHNYKIETYFPYEDLPQQDYIKTHMFTIPSHGTSAQITERILAIAEKENVDAVIILAPEQFIDYETNTYMTSVTGVGIKFKSNVDYLHNYRFIEKLHVYNEDQMSYIHIANMYPNFTNQIFQVDYMEDAPTAPYYYENFIKKYSIPFLVHEKSPDWRFTRNKQENIRRVLIHNNKPMIKLRVDIENKLPNNLSVKYYQKDNSFEKNTILINYANNQITEKTILDANKKVILKEKYVFDKDGKLSESIYFHVEGENERPFLKTQYIYFEDDDVFKYF